MAGVSDFERQGQAFNALGVELYHLLQEGDTSIVLVARAAGPAFEAHIRAFNPGGDLSCDQGRYREVKPTGGVGKAVREHRQVFYTPGKGTWFTLTMTVSADGGADADMDYDHEPAWDSPVDPAVYAQDLKHLGRDESAQPEWLRQHLAQAGPAPRGLRSLFPRRHP